MEGLGALSRLGLEGLLLFVYPNLLSSGSIYRLEGGKEFFHRVLRFFSSITRFDVAGKHWKKLFVWWMQSG